MTDCHRKAQLAAVPCFLVEYTGKGRLYRRRYTLHPCRAAGRPALSFHNAVSVLPEVVDDPIIETSGFRHLSFVHGPGTEEEARDGRWPTKCEACNYVFHDADEWQIGTESIYRRVDDGREGTLRELGPGAMYEAFWLQPFHAGDDGKCWAVKLPDGVEWAIDGLSNSGGVWTRTGVAPKFTVKPSILTHGYHGFLTDGVLVPC